jgi:hypothetical protein
MKHISGHGRVSLEDAKAEWGFNEIGSDRTRAFYHDPRVPILREQFKGRAVYELTKGERDTLCEIWESARGAYLSGYLVGVNEFEMKSLSPSQVAELWAMSQMDPKAKGRFFSMLAYATSPRPIGAGSENDPRAVADRQTLLGVSIQPVPPIVVGLSQT